MKKLNIFIFIIIIIILLSLTGCIEGHMHFTFNLDGSADIDFVLLSSSTLGLLQREGEDFFDDMKIGLEKDGFILEVLKKDGMTGFRANKHTQDPDDLAALSFFGGLGDLEQPEIIITEGLFFNTYNFSHTFMINLPGFGDEGGGNLARLINPDLKFLVTFPANPSSHNAHIVSDDGKTLQWNLSFTEENIIEVEVNVPNVMRIALVIIATLAVFILTLVIIKKTAAKKDATDKNNKV